jgi:hypothetical protein
MRDFNAPVSNNPTIYAFLFAPATTPLVFFLRWIVADGTLSSNEILTDLLASVTYILPCAYAAELALGLPAWWAFKQYGISSWAAFASAGCVIGWAVSLVILKEPVPFSLKWVVSGGPVCAVAGLLSALVFRGISYRFESSGSTSAIYRRGSDRPAS